MQAINARPARRNLAQNEQNRCQTIPPCPSSRFTDRAAAAVRTGRAAREGTAGRRRFRRPFGPEVPSRACELAEPYMIEEGVEKGMGIAVASGLPSPYSRMAIGSNWRLLIARPSLSRLMGGPYHARSYDLPREAAPRPPGPCR